MADFIRNAGVRHMTEQPPTLLLLSPMYFAIWACGSPMGRQIKTLSDPTGELEKTLSVTALHLAKNIINNLTSFDTRLHKARVALRTRARSFQFFLCLFLN